MERIAFAHLVSQKFVGEYCDVTILRDRKIQHKKIKLAAPKYLVPECLYDVPPRYFITGGTHSNIYIYIYTYIYIYIYTLSLEVLILIYIYIYI